MDDAEEQVENLQEALMQSEDAIIANWNQDISFKSLLIWALSSFEGELYLKLIDLLLAIKDERALFELYRQLLNPKIEADEKQHIVKGLLAIGEQPPFYVDVDGKVLRVNRLEELTGREGDVRK